MPALIKGDAIIDDVWHFPVSGETPPEEHAVCNLDDWLEASMPPVSGIQLYSGDSCVPLYDYLDSLALIAVYFSVFTDGRGFSIARELRDRGYSGELRARGHILPDQMHFLRRCGFDAFQPEEDARLQASLERLKQFTEGYQASIDQPTPLFRRRA